MNIIEKIISFIKNIFVKQEKVKMLTEPKIDIKQDRKNSFIESLKITTTKNKVETLTCNGDGLGIQKKIRS